MSGVQQTTTATIYDREREGFSFKAIQYITGEWGITTVNGVRLDNTVFGKIARIGDFYKFNPYGPPRNKEEGGYNVSIDYLTSLKTCDSGMEGAIEKALRELQEKGKALEEQTNISWEDELRLRIYTGSLKSVSF